MKTTNGMDRGQLPVSEQLASMTRMFHDACTNLGIISEALGLDPDEGGAVPILVAIDELKKSRDEWVDAQYADDGKCRSCKGDKCVTGLQCVTLGRDAAPSAVVLDERAALSKDAIREVFMAHGFTVKEGQADLKQYVYDAAYALLARAAFPHPVAQPVGQIVDVSDLFADRATVIRVLDFYKKHAMGALAAPSCLCCGRSTQDVEVAIKHMDLPDIVVCAECHRAIAQPVEQTWAPVISRDFLGQIVREAWVKWAKQQPNPKPSWLAQYAELSEADKEADRQIGEAVLQWVLSIKSATWEVTPAQPVEQREDVLKQAAALCDQLAEEFPDGAARLCAKTLRRINEQLDNKETRQ
ncbi:hypothetical protein [Paraburkholderia domus]|uniref:hypothetical protein n=1 Tax=Paraburkholderia domus TaxID=2793075 RepID=UPI0019127F9C|nr:hypothetical protein [Paraburkholderia domus]MBK5061747.1 hypothetical protein [Burkholderia sp. R-70199]CAE6899715.1 hypothetical protein R70199_03620 [Paraburkholderia domus]